MIFYIIQHYLIMFVQSYSPPIPTSITAKSTCVHKSVTENSFRLNVGVCVCWGWKVCMMYVSAAHPLSQEDMEGQQSQELEIEGHSASIDILSIH